MDDHLSPLRKGKITASVVGAILGLDPWRTRDDVLRMMVRQHFGAPSEWQDNPATAWGKANEAGAKIEYTMETGHTIFDSPFVLHENGWLGATPDGAVGNGGLIEIKCPYGIRHQPAPVSFKSIQEQRHYFAQMQIQMFCTGAIWTDFWQWTMQDTKLERVDRDDTFLEWAIPELYAFYNHFLSVVADEDATKEHVEDTFPVIDTEDGRSLVTQYREIVAEEERLKTRKENMLKQIVAAAGNKKCFFGGAKLNYIERVGAVSYAKVVKDHLPHLDLNPYRGKPSHYWTLK
jgi:putative phage-type endonuclease